MKRALTARNVLTTKFHTLRFDGVWREAVGEPELTGSWDDSVQPHPARPFTQPLQRL